MYVDFFGLRELPFNNCPDPRFFFSTPDHEEALASLIYAVQARKGFVLLTGEVGAGKTLVSRMMLRHFGNEVAFATINHALQNAGDLMESLCAEFEIPFAPSSSNALLVRKLHDFLLDRFAQDGSAVLVLDEAQTVPVDAFEQLRMIGNLEADDAKLLQIVILGQPELQARFASPELRQLRQRIFRVFHLPAMDRDSTAGYIRHRLQIAGAVDHGVFEDTAIDVIHEHSQGLPRLVNTLCDNAMLSAYSADQSCIDAPLVESVVAQMMTLRRSRSSPASSKSGYPFLEAPSARLELLQQPEVPRPCPRPREASRAASVNRYDVPDPGDSGMAPREPSTTRAAGFSPRETGAIRAAGFSPREPLCARVPHHPENVRLPHPPLDSTDPPVFTGSETHPRASTDADPALSCFKQSVSEEVARMRRRVSLLEHDHAGLRDTLEHARAVRDRLEPMLRGAADTIARAETSRAELADQEAKARQLAARIKSIVGESRQILNGIRQVAARSRRTERGAREMSDRLAAQVERLRGKNGPSSILRESSGPLAELGGDVGRFHRLLQNSRASVSDFRSAAVNRSAGREEYGHSDFSELDDNGNLLNQPTARLAHEVDGLLDLITRNAG